MHGPTRRFRFLSLELQQLLMMMSRDDRHLVKIPEAALRVRARERGRGIAPPLVVRRREKARVTAVALLQSTVTVPAKARNWVLAGNGRTQATVRAVLRSVPTATWEMETRQILHARCCPRVENVRSGRTVHTLTLNQVLRLLRLRPMPRSGVLQLNQIGLARRIKRRKRTNGAYQLLLRYG